MVKQVSFALISLLALTATTAFATTTPLCTRAKVAGSYIWREEGFIEQLALHDDGTAYFSQSSFWDHFATWGAQMPGIGTWRCVNGNTLVATFITTSYRSEAVEDPLHFGEVVSDVVPDFWFRATYRFTVQTRNRLERNFSSFKDFALTDDPLSSASVPFDVRTSDDLHLYDRILVVSEDLP